MDFKPLQSLKTTNLYLTFGGEHITEKRKLQPAINKKLITG